MAQIKRNFLKSKMNQDLDARLIQNGEYREGRNINVSRSEGADVGALENIRGNEELTTPLMQNDILSEIRSVLDTNESLEIIGLFKHDQTKSLYAFCTTWIDSSTSGRDNRFGGHNFILQYQLGVDPLSGSTNNNISKRLVQGSFLNFAKEFPITGFNIIEDQLFWTDDRNQPRKININKAFVNSSVLYTADPRYGEAYYFTEDQISVAKFAPYEAIKFVKNTGTIATPNWVPTWKNETSEWLPASLTAPLNSITTTSGNVQLVFSGTPGTGNPGWDTAIHDIDDYCIKSAGNDWPVWRIRNFSRPNIGPYYAYTVSGNTVQLAADRNNLTSPLAAASAPSWGAGELITFELLNPEYQSSFEGDREYMKDKFIRFSYRFKYNDNEYSLMAPFTQPLFVPKQYGSFTVGNEANAARNGILKWFENSVNSAELIIQLPDNSYQFTDSNIRPPSAFPNRYDVKEIEILLKSSSDNNVYSIDTIDLTNSSWINNIVPHSATTWPYNSQLSYTYKGSKPFQVLPESDVIRVSDAVPVRALAQEVGGNRVMYGNYLNGHAAPPNLDYECSITKKASDYDATNNPPISPEDPTVVKEYYNSTLKQGRTYQVGIILSDRYGRQSNVILANTDLTTAGSNVRDKSTVFAPYDGVGLSAGVQGFFGNALNVNFESTIPSSISGLENYPGLFDKSLTKQGETNPLGWYSYKVVVKQTEQEYYNCYIPGGLSGIPTYNNTSTDLSYTAIYDVGNISLYGDNINKIPKDTTDISPTDKMFGSKTSLYYRVVTPGYNASNQWNNREFTPVTEIEVTNIQQWNDFAPWTTTKGSSSTLYPDNDPIYNADKNPFIATLDISNLESNPPRLFFTYTDQYTPNYRFAKFLNVAETNPTISNLDIYWETSTSGLISDLNASIISGDSSGSPKELSPFMWVFEEQYPYDGEGTLPSNKGDYLLQQDIGVVTNAGSYSTNANASMTLNSVYSDTDPTEDLMRGNSYFTLEPINTVIGGDPYNTWNLKFASEQIRLFDGYFNTNLPIPSALQGNLTFNFTLEVPGETPSIRKVSVTNNFITNNEPTWQYLKGPSWGVPAIVPDPSDPNDLKKSIPQDPGYWVDDTTLLLNKRPELSPFLPLKSGPGLVGLNENANQWRWGRDSEWSMSIDNQKKATNSSGSTNQILGRLFKKVSGNWRPYIETYSISDGTGITSPYSSDSAVRFNEYRLRYATNSTSFGTGTPRSSDGIFYFGNGGFGYTQEGAEPYIKRCELAIYNNDSFNVGPPYTPVRDFKDFELVGTSGVNGPQYRSSDRTWGYYKFPFDIKKPSKSVEGQYLDISMPLNSNEPMFRDRWVFLVDPYNPPFCQFDSTKNNGDFKPIGSLNGSDFCVYKLTVGLRETFTGGLINSNEMIIYVKIFQ